MYYEPSDFIICNKYSMLKIPSVQRYFERMLLGYLNNYTTPVVVTIVSHLFDVLKSRNHEQPRIDVIAW